MRIHGLLLASGVTLALGACTTTPGSDRAATAPEPVPGCNAEAVQAAIGHQATPEVVEQARADAGASTVRTLKPDQAVTMEYLEGRLNLVVDASNTITSARCG